ncbi:hypothetical protein ARMGADRAFT_778550 [Armillaria gallica]|uniref:Uncharacterized protein n=1 Tax=Armillaria gallica TaxID=47427 RepID=A0A2H3CEL6_ARMGA|nr:hypothetical protein ARMGADRAFT_778550 [Armillaria gallica]
MLSCFFRSEPQVEIPLKTPTRMHWRTSSGIVWPRLFPRRVSGRGTTQYTHPIFRPGGTLWSSSAHTMPYQRSLTRHARRTPLLALVMTSVMNSGSIQGTLHQWNAERVDIPGTSVTFSCTSDQHFISRGHCNSRVRVYFIRAAGDR